MLRWLVYLPSVTLVVLSLLFFSAAIEVGDPDDAMAVVLAVPAVLCLVLAAIVFALVWLLASPHAKGTRT